MKETYGERGVGMGDGGPFGAGLTWGRWCLPTLPVLRSKLRPKRQGDSCGIPNMRFVVDERGLCSARSDFTVPAVLAVQW